MYLTGPPRKLRPEHQSDRPGWHKDPRAPQLNTCASSANAPTTCTRLLRQLYHQPRACIVPFCISEYVCIYWQAPLWHDSGLHGANGLEWSKLMHATLVIVLVRLCLSVPAGGQNHCIPYQTLVFGDQIFARVISGRGSAVTDGTGSPSATTSRLLVSTPMTTLAACMGPPTKPQHDWQFRAQ